MTRLSFFHVMQPSRRAVAGCAAAAVVGTLIFAGSAAAAELTAERDIALTQVDSVDLAPTTVIGEFVVDATTKRGYYVDTRTEDLVVYDVGGSTLTPITSVGLGTHPTDVAINPVTHAVVVADYDDNTLTVIDGNPASPTVDTVTATIATGGTGGAAVAVDFLGGTAGVAYVANSTSANVSVVDLASTSATLVTVGAAPFDVAVDATAHTAFVADRMGDSITPIIGSTPAAAITLTGKPSTVQFAGNRLLVGIEFPSATPTEFRVDAFDVGGNLVGQSENLGGAVLGIAVDEGLELIYASTDNGALMGLRSDELLLESPASLIADPVDEVTVDPGTHRVFTSHSARLGAVIADYDVQASPIVRPGLATGVVGTPFRFFVSTIAAPEADDFSVIGALPPGLALDPMTGEIHGTPTAPGTYTFTIQAANGFRIPGAALIEIVITGEAPMSPSFTSGPPIDGKVGEAYHFTVTASGYPSPTFAVTFGALPAGLVLDPTTGVISGTPTTAGTASFSITASNASGDISAEYTLLVRAADPTPTPTPTPSASTTPAPPARPGTTGGSGTAGSGTAGGRLASTGASAEPIAVVGLLALLVGGAALGTGLVARRHRRARG